MTTKIQKKESKTQVFSDPKDETIKSKKK